MLTERQQGILDFINEYVKATAFRPRCVRSGGISEFIRRRFRTTFQRWNGKGICRKSDFNRAHSPFQRLRAGSLAAGIPIVGRVAAGLPLLAQENIEDMIQLPKDWAPAGAFLLKVQGRSMEGAHILDGDYVLVHPAANGGEW